MNYCHNCGFKLQAGAQLCPACGKPFQAFAFARDGKKLIVPRGTTVLPPFCVKCAEPATATAKKNFGWHSPWLYLMVIFPGLLIYAIVATIVMKRMKFEVPVCDRHDQRRRMLLLTGWLFLLGCIPLGIWVGETYHGGIGFLIGFLAFIASLVFFILGTNILKPTLIDEEHGEFTGACEAFLMRIPVQTAATTAGR